MKQGTDSNILVIGCLHMPGICVSLTYAWDTLGGEQLAGNHEPQQRYKAANIVKVTVDFNRKTEAELVERIEEQPNRAGYLKRLVKEDIRREGNTQE